MYGRVAAVRRRWYERPGRRRRLSRPVISVGNLVVGGSGKTPTVAALAQMLLAEGERPAVLSRGYGRRRHDDRVIVVSDGERISASVQESGDEPQMLARMLTGVPVLVSPRRYDAGTVAERLGATVLLLDDGFQHLALARDIDLLIVSPEDLDEQVLPAGLLREPLAAARTADALLVPGTLEEARSVSATLGVPRAFVMQRQVEAPRAMIAGDAAPAGAIPGPVFVVAGIARPRRFVDAVRDQGWQIAGERMFGDHHWFDAREVESLEREARQKGAAFILTTEKDATRLRDLPLTMHWRYLPLRVTVGPDEAFSQWMRVRLAAARRESAPAPEGARHR